MPTTTQQLVKRALRKKKQAQSRPAAPARESVWESLHQTVEAQQHAARRSTVH
ncbi:MAG: hypothetical protein ACXU8N_01520 [Telluria sp.]